MFERVPEFRDLHLSPNVFVIVDGMPIIWLLRLFGFRIDRSRRTTWLDWFEDALDRAAVEGKRVYILGHTPEALRAGLQRAREQWPSLAIDGADGYFDAENPNACRAATAAANAFAPDIVFVGMGMPRQEIFASRYRSDLNAPVVGLGGAAFAYFAGDQASPPRWLGDAGFEWLYRLGADPRRLAGRYLVEPFALVCALSLRLIRERRSGVLPSSAADLG